MGMMQQMMQGGMMQGGDAGMPMQSGASEASRGYVQAMMKSGSEMMRGIQDADPDVAFVKGMIPHHQAAIAMAKVALQYGKDEQAKKWANDVIREQQREIAEMQDWLNRRAK
jgi:uncharacterized protein (DUF305 family)